MHLSSYNSVVCIYQQQQHSVAAAAEGISPPPTLAGAAGRAGEDEIWAGRNKAGTDNSKALFLIKQFMNSFIILHKANASCLYRKFSNLSIGSVSQGMLSPKAQGRRVS